jgi:hypothetical protein
MRTRECTVCICCGRLWDYDVLIMTSCCCGNGQPGQHGCERRSRQRSRRVPRQPVEIRMIQAISCLFPIGAKELCNQNADRVPHRRILFPQGFAQGGLAERGLYPV